MSAPDKDNPLTGDLEEILESTEGFRELRGERVFVTGGGGFIGAWLLESLLWANDRLGLGASIAVLVRSPKEFARKLPHLAARADIECIQGDVRTFAFPEGEFSHIIHAAAPTGVRQLHERPADVLSAIIHGTERVLELARKCRACRLLLTSSGAVYGAQPVGVDRVDESALGAPDCSEARSAYGEGKRVAELLCTLASKEPGGPQAKIARCFTFGGPYQRMDSQYAFASFMGDRLRDRAIRVRGKGLARRSYLYAGDLASWLWAVLFRGAPGRPYNVGSDQAISIAELAATIARLREPAIDVVFDEAEQAGLSGNCYVPSVERARRELGVEQRVSLAEMMTRTLMWYAQREGDGAAEQKEARE